MREFNHDRQFWLQSAPSRDERLHGHARVVVYCNLHWLSGSVSGHASVRVQNETSRKFESAEARKEPNELIQIFAVLLLRTFESILGRFIGCYSGVVWGAFGRRVLRCVMGTTFGFRSALRGFTCRRGGVVDAGFFPRSV